jgi:hypothetical protein
LDHPNYKPTYLEQDLRRLNEAALDLLWRINPAANASAPTWLPGLLTTNTHRAAWELMSKLLLILDEVHDVETTAISKNWSRVKGRMPRTGYPLRYIADDLRNLNRALTDLAARMHRREFRKIGPEVPARRLRWLAEDTIARAEPILEAVSEAPTIDQPAKGMLTSGLAGA